MDAKSAFAPWTPALLALILVVGLTSCFHEPILPLSLDTPPLILAPAALAGVTDGRGRFREILCAIRADHGRSLPDDRPCEEVLLALANEPHGSGRPVALGGPRRPLRIAVVPGIFGECFIRLVSPFADGLAHLRTHGYRTDVIHVSALSGSPHNARQIRKAVMGMELGPGERLLLIGYSKGTSDALEALVRFPEIVPRVAALMSVAGVVAGSPLADGLPDLYARLLRHLDVKQCDPGDHRGVESLRRSTRLTALAGAPLPSSVRYFSVGGIVSSAETSSLLRAGRRALDVVDPRNDGQVIFTDTVIPGGTLLGFVRADHWAIALPFSRSTPTLRATLIEHNAFPREVLLEAIVRAVEEAL
jgi:pimeloyl-ACP methyl ester carboxylesterase